MMADRPWTKGPWRLVWWGNETYPFPLSILADNDGQWITRGGTASSEANARLFAAAPELYEALEDAEHFVRGKVANVPRSLRGNSREEDLHAKIVAALAKAPEYRAIAAREYYDNYEPSEAELTASLNLGGESGDARLARQQAEARKLK